jgi:hypothetical protein
MDINYLIKIYNIEENEKFEFRMLEKYDYIAGPIYGAAASYSEQWIIYKEIMQKYTNEVIETEYYLTNSIVLKIYLYWILRENNWVNIENIYIDLLKNKDIKIDFAPGGCIVLSNIPIEDIVNNKYQEYRIDQEFIMIMENLVMPELNLDFMSGKIDQ